jgi:hypothetical protein
MLKLILCLIVLGVTLVFVVGFVKVVHTVEGVQTGIQREEERKQAEDQRILRWAESPTPGYDSGSHK